MTKKNKKKKREAEKKINCVAYLSTDGDFDSIEYRERNQLRCIREYACAHNINITKVLHRDVLGQADINRHFKNMVSVIRAGKVEGIIVMSMMSISSSIPDAYYKIGEVIDANGVMVTVLEGRFEGLYIRKKVEEYDKKFI